MIKYRYVGLFVFSLFSTEVVLAKPCASAGGKFPAGYKNALKISVYSDEMSGYALSEKQKKQVANALREYGADVDTGQNVQIFAAVTSSHFFTPGDTKVFHYSINDFQGNDSISRTFERSFMNDPGPDWDNCDPRENKKYYKTCCDECMSESGQEWELANIFNRGFILHEEELLAPRSMTRNRVHLLSA